MRATDGAAHVAWRSNVEEGARRGAWAEAPPKCSAAAAPLSRPRTSTTFNEIRTHCEAYCSTRVRTLSTLLIFTYTSTRTRCDSHSTRNPHLHRGLTTFERLKKIGSKAAAIRHTIVHSLRAGIPVPAALIKSFKVKVEPGHLVIVNPVDVARTQTLPLCLLLLLYLYQSALDIRTECNDHLLTFPFMARGGCRRDAHRSHLFSLHYFIVLSRQNQTYCNCLSHNILVV